MPLPIRHLPVIQNWDCHQCGNCCTDYWVPVTPEERRRIESQGWSELPEFQGIPLFVRYGPFWRGKWRLNQREGDRCIFLDERGLCRIHARFGPQAKPFACRLFPYVLVPVGNHYRVSLRFACPSATANKGRPVVAQLEELQEFAEAFERWHREMNPQASSPTTDQLLPLGQGDVLGWSDILIFADEFLRILQKGESSLVQRWLVLLYIARVCWEARFDKVRGARLREFLQLLADAAQAELAETAPAASQPSWVGRILFRNFLAISLRKDQGVRRGLASRSRWRLMWAMWRMLRGRGKLPPLQQGLPDVTFEELEAPLPELPPSAWQLLERYYLVKIQSLQFFGPAFMNYPFLIGLEMLALTLPMILWLARGYGTRGGLAAVEKAVQVIDENFGYSPFLDSPRQRLALRILASRQETERLILWYARSKQG
ncbi:MAG: YkgJ family cysteine cluster protein [Gemmatales bacterium]|nr:YkgJ family cysteine cluster protein [Gemmatales bacterium]MCS7161519.1 YkgJ family cysteine cluster protein [Gemmatales bacterium]MDW8176722.1 YkgJ family cysteine cluster protein [Gemmatales bacterium]MDW8223160.1 YkgJ family cysteine cluster protein [Gemmatales bacterium]